MLARLGVQNLRRSSNSSFSISPRARRLSKRQFFAIPHYDSKMPSAPHEKRRRTRGVCHVGSWDTVYRCYRRARTSQHDIDFVVLYRAERRAVLVRRRGDSGNYFLCVASVAAAALCQRDRLLTRRGGVSHLSRETSHDEHGSALVRSL